MADTQEPRNEMGQTYDEWVISQRTDETNEYGQKNIEPWDLIVGINSQRGVSGVKLSEIGIIVGRVVRPISPTMTGYNQQAIAQYGTTYQGMSFGSKTFQIPITIKASSKEEYNSKSRALVNILITPNDNSELGVVFGEEPDIIYYGHFENIPDPQPLTETSWDYSTTLSFVASDPRGFYNQEPEIVDMSSGSVSFTPKGTAFSDPEITIIPKNGAKPLTQFGYTINRNEKTTAGLSSNTIKMFDTKPAVFIDEMNDTANWKQIMPGATSENVSLPFELPRKDILTDGAIVGTEFSSVTNNKAGTAHASWTSKPEKYKPGQSIGPVAISKTNFSSTIGDGNWETSFKIHNIKRYSRSSEGMEMYILDSDGNRRARFGIRSWNPGERAHAWIHFGKNWDDEVKALQTGLGTQKDDYGLDEDYVNKKDVSVPMWNGTTVSSEFDTFKRTTTYHLVKYGGKTHRTDEWWTITETTIYDPAVKKYKKTVKYSPIRSQYTKNANNNIYVNKLFRSNHNDLKWNSTYNDAQKLIPAKIDYWKKGQPRRVNNYYKNPPIRGKYYTNNTTPKKAVCQNYTDITISDETRNVVNNSPSTSVRKTSITMHFVNGDTTHRESIGGYRYVKKFGILERVSYKYDRVTTPKNTKTQNKMVDYPDKRESGTYDDVFLSIIIGHDNNGFYWQINKLGSDGNETQPLVPKTYDKRPDLHDKYKFTPDKMAMHFFKILQPEDKNIWKDGDEENDGSKYKPVKNYQDNYMTVYDVRVYKLLDRPDYTDLINLKPGQIAQFNTENNSLTIDGKLRQELINPDSTFPQIRGGEINNIEFFPDPGDDFDIKLRYRPTIL